MDESLKPVSTFEDDSVGFFKVQDFLEERFGNHLTAKYVGFALVAFC